MYARMYMYVVLETATRWLHMCALAEIVARCHVGADTWLVLITVQPRAGNVQILLIADIHTLNAQPGRVHLCLICTHPCFGEGNRIMCFAS